MLAKDFNYDRYHMVFDPKQENLRKFMKGEWKGPLLAETFAGTDTVLHPIIFPGEPFERLRPLMRDDIKIIINLATTGTVEEKNAQYDEMEAFFRPYRNP